MFDHLPALHSLDLGTEASFFLHQWPFEKIQTQLIKLTITLARIYDLFDILSTEPLRDTLMQLHVTMSNVHNGLHQKLFDFDLVPRMTSLEVFSFVKPFDCCFGEEWTIVERMTSGEVMPILRKLTLCIVIDKNEFLQLSKSELFTDSRHVDVHFALIVTDDQLHIELLQYVGDYFQYRSRSMASATFLSQSWPDNQSLITPGQYYVCFLFRNEMFF